MKALITGSSGFIGKHLAEEFRNNGYEVVRCDVAAGPEDTVKMDILDQEAVEQVLAAQKPDVIVHLAGQANVGLSWKKPQLTFELNVIGLINVLEAVRAVDPQIRVLTTGSADEYGVLRDRGNNVTEDFPLHPINPYAISKSTAEQVALMFVRSYGLDVCMMRLFNLGGAGQAKGFMISDFASGIAEVEAGRREALLVGNLESARDFTHVEDACRAIRLIAEKGRTGEAYNICSGKAFTAQEVVDRLIAIAMSDGGRGDAGTEGSERVSVAGGNEDGAGGNEDGAGGRDGRGAAIEVRQDPSRLRPSDTPILLGNHDKLTAHTGWVPEKDLDAILLDALNYWRAKVAEEDRAAE